MPLNSLKTGRTDFRLTEVQQPKVAATWSRLISSRAFSAKSGQLEAGSTTTASSFLPSRPPFLFCSSMSISMTSLSVVSEIAIVPESECRMPTLIVSSAAKAEPATRPLNAAAANAANAVVRLITIYLLPPFEQDAWEDVGGKLRKSRASEKAVQDQIDRLYG